MIKKIQKSNKKSIKLLNKSEFRVPYQILIDESFINNMNKYGKKYKHLKEVFKSEPKLFFTKCIYNKYKSMNPNFESDISDNCEMVKCPHKDKSDVMKCLGFVFRRFNKNHYIVGTSNKEVMDKYRERSDVPLLNFAKGQIRLFVNTEKITKISEFETEASPKELERLERIFKGGEVSEASGEFEEVNVEELEVSNDNESNEEVDVEELEDENEEVEEVESQDDNEEEDVESNEEESQDDNEEEDVESNEEESQDDNEEEVESEDK